MPVADGAKLPVATRRLCPETATVEIWTRYHSRHVNRRITPPWKAPVPLTARIREKPGRVGPIVALCPRDLTMINDIIWAQPVVAETNCLK